jgi:ABC-type Fe3+/spermidine/putrescine transport system ATPase subunit
MLTGIDRPSRGHVLFAGQELRALSEDGLARWRGKHVGIVFQFFQLIPTLTALENVLLALELGGGGGLKRRHWRARIHQTLGASGLQNTSVQVWRLVQAQETGPLPIVYLLFDAVAIMVAFMGLLGLSHTLAASVLERRLEVGILRSLGATGWHVGTVFMIEALALGIIAWGLGAVFGLPGGAAIVNVLGAYFGPIDVFFRPLIVLITLLFVIVVAFVASIGPALSASRVRIRGTLRYE